MNELDRVLDALPKAIDLREGVAKGEPALVWLDATGKLNIVLNNGGWLWLEEKDHGHLQADASGV